MNFLKAAAGTALACLMCAGMSLTAMAEQLETEVISAGGEDFEIQYAEPSQDAGYLKYKKKLVEAAMGKNSPAGRIKSDFREVCEYGSYLGHDTRFDGLGRSFGIDVSQWQSKIDWKKVKNDGIDYAIIRLGVRGYGSAGTLMMDDRYYENIKGAKEAGLDVGVYFYTQAITVKEAQQEADYCAAALKGYDLELPVYFDIESVDYDRGRLDCAGLNKAQKTELCRAFCDRIETYGYQSGVYANLYWLNHMIDGPALGMDYKTWIAAYLSSIDYGGIYDLWQYSSCGDIDGINGNVDMNVMYDVDYSPQTNMELDINDGILSWNEAEYADGYTVYGSDDGKESYFIADTNSTEFDLIGQTAQKFSVAAYNYFGGKRHYGKASEYIDGFRGTPQGLTVVRSGIDKVVLSWQPVDDAVGYQVYLIENGEEKFLVRTNKTSYEIKGSSLGDKSVKVRAYNEAGVTGLFSDEKKLLHNAPETTPRLDLSADKLSWTEVEGADGYVVTCSCDGENVERCIKENYCFVDESESGRYFVQAYIELEGKRFRTPSSNVCEFNGVNYPPKGEITLDSCDDGLVWNKINDALGYVVYEVSADGEEKEVARVDGLSYSDDDLTGTVYFVKGYNTKDGEEFFTEPSNRIVISLPEVTEAKLESLSDDRALISWNEIEDCSEYMVYLDKGKGYELYTTVKGSMAMIAGLGNTEFASVRVKGYVGNEEFVSYGLFSNQLYIIGSEDTRPNDEVFSFDDLLGNK